jgi:hypothetical protein
VVVADLDDGEAENTIRLIEQRGGRAFCRRADTSGRYRSDCFDLSLISDRCPHTLER